MGPTCDHHDLLVVQHADHLHGVLRRGVAAPGHRLRQAGRVRGVSTGELQLQGRRLVWTHGSSAGGNLMPAAWTAEPKVTHTGHGRYALGEFA